ncbi:MAG: glutamine amidotransferase, partial [Kiritimatiellaeota bacterium]|nr:glutamine amidotransferase [Kiritimatiellota bacterium]
TTEAGLYEVRLTVRPSHTNCRISFTSSVDVVQVGDAAKFMASLRTEYPNKAAVSFPGHGFAVALAPETRTFKWLHSGRGGLQFAVVANSDEREARQQWLEGSVKEKAAPSPSFDMGSSMGGGDWGLDLDFELSQDNAVFFVLDKIEYRRLSSSVMVEKVWRDKIRYRQGETLKGTAFLKDVGREGGRGTLNLYLEHGVNNRVKVGEVPVALTASTQQVPFEFVLPTDELGYAVVAEYVSEDGKDWSEAKEYFTIADNFQRVALAGFPVSTHDHDYDDDAPVREAFRKAIEEYYNFMEYFSWAEDDMVGMSPDKEYWSSGQTNYRLGKKTLQRQIRVAHEMGVAMVTYGKAGMSGRPGWEMLYDYPEETRGVFFYPVGTWFKVDVPKFDRFRDQDFRVYSRGVHVKGHAFDTWWADFIEVWPDATPHWARAAAEEVVRSIEMFGWDAIRWDGHPNGGGQTGGNDGRYDYRAARRTQTLVRYFKDIVAQKFPDFRHGYNYLLIEPEKTHDWAVEDFELDELCRDGGLLMNESIGNSSSYWKFSSILRNLQVEGDLCRERGGFYLGISYAGGNEPRDIFIESVLWGAAGCRPYNNAMNMDTRRYLTRYAEYTLDETLRRLVTPEKVLTPQDETRVTWDAFVYETVRKEGKSQLVVNLLNIPLDAQRPMLDNKDPPVYDMPAGTPPVKFTLTLPQGMKATAAHWINPKTLDVTEATVAGNTVDAPAVEIWQVVIIDLESDETAPTLASLYGPPKTFGVKREGVKDEDRAPELVLDVNATKAEANAAFKALEEAWITERIAKGKTLSEMPTPERNATMAQERTPLATILDDWQKGASTPADLALENTAFAFGDLTPERNGVMDVYYARGAMDYRLKVPALFGGLERVSYHDAPFWGGVRSQHGDAGLANAVPWNRFPEFDLLLYTGIPHQAIGAENAYAIRDYVKAGGGVLFTGGEYAFGRGGYLYTVLDRDVLPVACFNTFDTYCPEVPALLEPGPDFDELGVTVDFSQQPRVWIYNLVAPRPGAKVFLKAGDIPILVGWEFGAGRVLCLLTEHRGKATSDWTPFFDWDDWPRLGTAMLEWCAPEAYTGEEVVIARSVFTTKQPSLKTTEATQRLLEELKSATDDDLLADLDRGMAFDMDLPDRDTGAKRTLPQAQLDRRVAVLRKAAKAAAPEVSDILAEQLASVDNLPCETRMQIAVALQRTPSRQMAKHAASAFKSGNSALHGGAYLLLALSGDEAFAALAAKPEKPGIEEGQAERDRLRDLAVARSAYPKPGLEAHARARVTALDAIEAGYLERLKNVMMDDTAMTETAPSLNADDLLERMGWLGYLARQSPAEYGDPFLREWLSCHLYADYAHRTYDEVTDRLNLAWNEAEPYQRNWHDIARRLNAYALLNRDTALRIATEHPALAGASFARARVMSHARAAINLLGALPPNAIAAIFPEGKNPEPRTQNPEVDASGGLSTIRHPDLRAFVTARKKYLGLR